MGDNDVKLLQHRAVALCSIAKNLSNAKMLLKSLQRAVSFVAIGLITTGSTLGFADVPTTVSVVVFNTVCAQCHEMECSQRLSFSSNSPADNARSHIQNYAGSLDVTKIEDLFGLIKYTKKV
jgi:hypothetical protein